MDQSNGYDEIAERFIAGRNPSTGAAIVHEWNRTLPEDASVLDLGCGHGEPVARILMERGSRVFGVDASLRLLEEFRRRFPGAMAEHAAVEESGFFERTFDGIIAWGLMFLLSAKTQAVVIQKAATALEPGGRFLFTAPREAVSWTDAITGRESLSLGREEYRRILRDAGLRLDGEGSDEGENHYYFASKGVGESVRKG